MGKLAIFWVYVCQCVYVCKRAFVEVTGLLNIGSGLFGDWGIRKCRCQARWHGFVHAIAAGELA